MSTIQQWFKIIHTWKQDNTFAEEKAKTHVSEEKYSFRIWEDNKQVYNYSQYGYRSTITANYSHLGGFIEWPYTTVWAIMYPHNITYDS